jgi:chromosome segregation protein
MKITRLDLLNYGAFTARSTEFRADAKVHLIIGPNEAGKTTRRSSIADFLFGFPTRSNYALLGENTKLRVGATLSGESGEIVGRFIRRKGRKDTFQSVEGQALSERILDPLVQSFDREEFLKLFSISHIELAQGQELLVESNGDAGQALFGAASGGVNVHQLLKKFKDKYEMLYAKKSGAKRPLNAKLTEYDEVLGRRDAETVDARRWEEINADIARLDSDIVTRQKDIAQAERDFHYLQRILEVRDEIERYIANGLRLDDLRSEKLLPDAIYFELLPVYEAHQGYVENQTRVGEKLAAERSLLDSAGNDFKVLLTRQDECLQLISALEDWHRLRSDADLAELHAGVGESLRVLEISALELWGRISLEEICSRASSIDRASLLSVRRHMNRGFEADAKLQLHASEISRIEKELAAHDSGVTDEQKTLSVRLIEAVLEEIDSLGHVDQEILSVQESLERKAEEIATRIHTLGLSLADPLDCRLLAVPMSEVCHRFQKNLDVAARGLENLDEQIAELDDEIRARERLLAELRSEGRIVSTEMLQTIRTERDAAFNDLWGIQGGASGPATQRYIRYVRDADSDADERFRHAGHLSALAGHETELLQYCEKRAGLIARRDSRIAENERLESEWATYALSFRATLHRPNELEKYADALRQCIEEADAYCEIQAGLERLLATESRLHEDLRSCVGDEAKHLSFGTTLVAARRRLLQLRTEIIEAQSRRERAQEDRRLLETHYVQRAALQDEVDACSALVQPLILVSKPTADLRPSLWAENIEALEKCANAHAEYLEICSRRNRLQQLEADVAIQAREILTACLPSLLIDFERKGFDALSGLGELLTSARERRDRELQATLACAALENTLNELHAELVRSHAHIDALLLKGNALGLDVSELVKRHRRLEALNAERRELTLHIVSVMRDTIDEVVRRVEAEDGYERITLECERLNRSLDTDRKHFHELLQQRGVAVAKSESVSRSHAAADSQSQAMQVAGEIERLAREYAGYFVAHKLLTDRARAYADEHQGPVMLEASKYFRILTLGLYDRIELAESESGESIVHAHDSTGTAKDVTQLSEGTCDQLYFAIRLATLTQRISGISGPPLLLDDPFRTFDDSRSTAAFQALGMFSQHAQIFYFTPRTAVADLARRALGAGVDLIVLESDQTPLLLL